MDGLTQQEESSVGGQISQTRSPTSLLKCTSYFEDSLEKRLLQLLFPSEIGNGIYTRLPSLQNKYDNNNNDELLM